MQINKRDLTRSRTPTDTERRYELSKITNKIDKENGKGLSTNDFTNEYKNKIDSFENDMHHHNNLGILNSITRDNINDWNNNVNYYNLFSSVEGTYDSITLINEEFDYNFLLFLYGNDNYFDTKIVIPTGNKYFSLSLDVDTEIIKSFYSFDTDEITKIKGSNDLYIYKIVGYKFKEGVI